MKILLGVTGIHSQLVDISETTKTKQNFKILEGRNRLSSKSMGILNKETINKLKYSHFLY